MPRSLSHLANHVLARDLAAAAANERVAISVVLEYIAEFDARRLYGPAGFDSMHQYCVKRLGYSEDGAGKRIHAARAARAFPALFRALADGRLHLSAVCMLATHLSPSVADDLIAEAAHKSKAEIALLLAARFPRPDLETRIRPIAQPAPGLMPDTETVTTVSLQHAPGHVAVKNSTSASEPDGAGLSALLVASRPDADAVAASAPTLSAPALPMSRARVTPLAPQRFALQVTLGQSAHDKLRYAQALLGHAVANGDVAAVLERALDALILHEEKRKFAVGARSRKRMSKGGGRYVPAEIRRAVFQRDGGKCTFVGDRGERCDSRERLELDHVIPVARGGRTTLENLRLRCRTHNQCEADRLLGAGFMQRKRDRGRAPAGAALRH